MVQRVNFDNNTNPNDTQFFNIDLDAQGNLNFNANGVEGNGDRRLRIDDDSGALTIGGAGTNGIVRLGNAAGRITIDLQGSVGNVILGANPAGGTPGQDGDLALRDGNGGTSISLSGSNGSIRCTSLTETSDVRLKQSIAPILNALDKVTALRGVCYEWRREARSELGRDEGSQVGFIGQEVEAVCPELVASDAEGYKSLNYSRLTAVLVEAVKEQQQLIHRQASALAEAMRRIAQVERALDAQ
jgi:hypothetical protein